IKDVEVCRQEGLTDHLNVNERGASMCKGLGASLRQCNTNTQTHTCTHANAHTQTHTRTAHTHTHTHVNPPTRRLKIRTLSGKQRGTTWRWLEGDGVCVCVRECERGCVGVCVCVCVRERERVCVRECVREREGVCERESVCVCVSMCVCV